MITTGGESKPFELPSSDLGKLYKQFRARELDSAKARRVYSTHAFVLATEALLDFDTKAWDAVIATLRDMLACQAEDDEIAIEIRGGLQLLDIQARMFSERQSMNDVLRKPDAKPVLRFLKTCTSYQTTIQIADFMEKVEEKDRASLRVLLVYMFFSGLLLRIQGVDSATQCMISSYAIAPLGLKQIQD